MGRETEPGTATMDTTVGPVAIIVTEPRLGPQPARPEPKRTQVHRPKHVPRRTCIACRDKDAKRTLTRIVRSPTGEIRIDPGGKQNGRGAYLCSQPSCWRKAVGTPLLGRALKTEIDDATRSTLQAFAASLPDQPTDSLAANPNERTS
ncbi:MAG: COG2740: Predicted nucleic-acid-binding protein implicated in transcription termination [uncultured Thermomicrobiales bacterium]|uniref:COG2740: Predicted nucleic-acid-binding protein implicated in transcription termination n=1 Tax=uncultured Thermomicrobiales bacterium TaxID=1645740 RepID=A0A6J4UWN3_9BACT|nr:MAG: COG2740: Predicted nucleic-acid-binding protein implicated in transcription termination [uncultured Thermomicrobiales bacterium]